MIYLWFRNNLRARIINTYFENQYFSLTINQNYSYFITYTDIHTYYNDNYE